MKKQGLILALAFSSKLWAGDFEDAEVAYKQQDYTKAFAKYTLAANQSNAQAKFMIGKMYQEGRGVEQNENKAAIWYMKAAEQARAQGNKGLAVIYSLGHDADSFAEVHSNLSKTQNNEGSIEEKTIK